MSSNKRKRLFNLDEDANINIIEGAKLNNMSKSAFVEFLANSWENSIDPSQKIKQIKSEKQTLKDRLSELEKQESQIMEILQKKDEWNKKRQAVKPHIMRNLMRIISEGRYQDAETIAKNQSISLGIPAIELLSEASNKLNGGQ